MKLVLATLAMTSCGALSWAEPLEQADHLRGATEMVTACRCLDQPPPPAPEVHTLQEGPARAGAAASTIDTVATIGGAITANPLVWGLAAQLLHLVTGAVRRRKTA